MKKLSIYNRDFYLSTEDDLDDLEDKLQLLLLTARLLDYHIKFQYNTKEETNFCVIGIGNPNNVISSNSFIVIFKFTDDLIVYEINIRVDIRDKGVDIYRGNDPKELLTRIEYIIDMFACT